MVLGKLNNHMQNNKMGLLFYTIHKNNSKEIKDLNVNWNHKTSRRKQEMWYIQPMEYYLALKKEGNPAVCDNMDKPGGH